MRNGVEIFRQVCIQHLGSSAAQGAHDLLDGLMGVASWPKTETARMEVRLEYRHQHQRRCHLYHPVFDGRYPQWPLATIAFRNEYPQHRARPIPLSLQFLLQCVQPPLPAFRVDQDAFKALPIDPWPPFVRSDPFERML